MDITIHKNSKGYTTAIHAQSDALGLKMVFRSTGSNFEQIHVYEKELLGLFWEKFLFKAGKSKNDYSVKDGFWIDARDLQRGEYPCKLNRRFFDEETQTHKSGCIMEMGFDKRTQNMYKVLLFDLVDGVLVPVIGIRANGLIEDREKHVVVREAPAPGARVMPKIKIDDLAKS